MSVKGHLHLTTCYYFQFCKSRSSKFLFCHSVLYECYMKSAPIAAFPNILYCTQLIWDYNLSQNLCFLQCLVKCIIVNVNNYASLLLLQFRNCVPSNVSNETFILKYSSQVCPACSTTFNTVRVCCCLCRSVLTMLVVSNITLTTRLIWCSGSF